MSDTWNLNKMISICLFFIFCLIVSVAAIQKNYSSLNNESSTDINQKY